MTLRDALRSVLSRRLAEAMLADMPVQWVIVAAFARIDAERLDTEAACQLKAAHHADRLP